MEKGKTRKSIKYQRQKFFQPLRISNNIPVLIIGVVAYFAFFLATVPLQAQTKTKYTTSKADLLGLEWDGSEAGRWDFTLVRRGHSNVFDYYATGNKDRSNKINGEVIVDLFGNKVKMRKVVEGKVVNVCDGTFSQDARFIGGFCYDLKEAIGQGRNTNLWWATVEQSKTLKKPSWPLNVNLATVKELESFLSLDPITARKLVGFKFLFGYFKEVDDLRKYSIVSKQVFEKIRKKISTK